MKRPVVMTAAVLALGIAAVPLSANRSHGVREYAVTVENLTPAGSQPLSPPLLVVHSDRAHVWGVGEIATHPVAGLAEDADNGPAISAYGSLPGVRSAATGVDRGATAAAPIAPGASQTYVVRARPGDRLSLLSMLVNTNDGFTGLDALRLRDGTVTVRARAYDAGSEVDDQLAAHIPGPAGGHRFVRNPEGAVITMHPGILPGVGDLDPAMYGWSGPVARITVAPAG